MVRTLYHGSAQILEHPRFGAGKPYNDYGLGFYCTEHLDMAMEWAVDRNRDGYANCYQLDCNGLSILDLNDSSYTVLHWLTLLLKNREFDAPSPLAQEAKTYLLEHFSIPYTQYDAIIGYRADDSYFSFAQDFINGTISYRQLGNAMHLGRLGQQFVLKSKAAFDRLQFLEYTIARHEDWYTRKMHRDSVARREYFDTERNRRQRGDFYITQIMDEEMNGNDLRLR